MGSVSTTDEAPPPEWTKVTLVLAVACLHTQLRAYEFMPLGPLISIIDDNLSVRRALRRLVQSASCVVETFASAREDATTRECVRQSGIAACLRKPFDGQVFLDAIESAVRPAIGRPT